MNTLSHETFFYDAFAHCYMFSQESSSSPISSVLYMKLALAPKKAIVVVSTEDKCGLSECDQSRHMRHAGMAIGI